MNLSQIIRRMEEIVRLNVVLHQIDAVSDIASILTRQEQSVPLTSAYWVTRGEGTEFVFGDSIGGSFFADNMRRLKGDQSLRGWKIDFASSKITEIPINEFIRTIEELEKITGKDERKKLVDRALKIAEQNGLNRTGDKIEDYGNHYLYFVTKCDNSWESCTEDEDFSPGM